MCIRDSNTIVPLLTLPYITRVLGTSNYGVFSLALNWVTYFQVIVEYGFGFTGARKVSVHGDDGLQELYSRIITARILLLCGTFFAMNILSVALHASSAQYVSMNILFLIILGVAFQLTWLFQGKQDMKLIAIINAVSRLFSVLMVFALVHSENHLYLYCICYAITFLLSAALGILRIVCIIVRIGIVRIVYIICILCVILTVRLTLGSALGL